MQTSISSTREETSQKIVPLGYNWLDLTAKADKTQDALAVTVRAELSPPTAHFTVVDALLGLSAGS